VWPDQEVYLRDHPEISLSALVRAAIDAHRGETSPFESDRVRRDEEARLAVRARLAGIEARRPTEIAALRTAFEDRMARQPTLDRFANRNWVESRRTAFATLAHDSPDELLRELEEAARADLPEP